MALELSRRGIGRALLFAITLAACIGWPVSAHSESRPSYGQSLEATLLEEPLVVDPLAARTHTDMTLVALFFDTLYRTVDGKPRPHLAASMPDFSNPLRVKIALRPGVKFNDGSPLRPRDVALSLERLRKSPLGFLLETVKTVSVASDAKSMSVVIVLKRADAKLTERLTDLHTAIVAGGTEPNWRRLVGTGPWRLGKRSTRNRSLVLKPNDGHFAGRVYLDGLTLRWHVTPDAEARAYESGTSHVSARGSIAFAGHRPKFQTQSVEASIGTLAYLGFGSASTVIEEPEFRQAVSASVGRLGMRHIGSGEAVQPTNGVLSPKRKARPFALQANTKVAKSLFKKIAVRFPELEARALTLQLIVNSSRPDDAVIAARVAAGLFQHGITTKILSLSPDVFLRRSRGGQCDLYIGQLARSGSPPLAEVRKAFVVGKQAKAAARLRGKSRAAVEREFAAALPIVPLFHRGLRLHSRNDVKGLEFSSAGTVDYPRVFFHGEAIKN